MNAAMCARYDTGRASGVLERTRGLQQHGGPIAVTAAMAGLERALRGGAAEGAERAAYELAQAVRDHYGDETAAYVRGENGGE